MSSTTTEKENPGIKAPMLQEQTERKPSEGIYRFFRLGERLSSTATKRDLDGAKSRPLSHRKRMKNRELQISQSQPSFDLSPFTIGQNQIRGRAKYPVANQISSVTPFVINEVVRVAGQQSNGNPVMGRLAISIAPGKKEGKLKRELKNDLEAIISQGYDTILCLLEWKELISLGIAEYPCMAQNQHLTFYHSPIRDRDVPKLDEAEAITKIIAPILTTGHNVLVHCRGGLGRAGVICACLLVYFGYDATDAIALVRKQRVGAIQTKKQELFVYSFAH